MSVEKLVEEIKAYAYVPDDMPPPDPVLTEFTDRCAEAAYKMLVDYCNKHPEINPNLLTYDVTIGPDLNLIIKLKPREIIHAPND